MNKSFYIKLICCACAVLCFVLPMLSVCVFAGQIDYRVTVDHPTSTSAENMPALLKNVVHGTDPELTIAGWIKTDHTIKAYEYTMDGGKTWKRTTKAIKSRPDVKQYCPNTYETAGFHLNIDVSALRRGTYDIFLRAFTDKDEVIDVLAMLNVTIGETDQLTMAYRELNLSAFGAQDGVLTLAAEAELMLDAYALREFQSFEVITDKSTELTLKSNPDSMIPFSQASCASVQNEDGTFATTVVLDNAQYAGKLMLTSTEQVNITRMRFYTTVPDYYKGELKVHMTATPFEYLSGANAAEATMMSDDTVGTFIQLFPTGNTNDPFIFFNLGKYLKETADVQVSADHYRYAVITLQTPATNSQGLFRLFLCAGDIRGPHGESHVSFTPINDGQWRTYVVPLCEEEHWNGEIYGMRLDFIDAHAKPGDYANIASIGLYPDEQSAKEAAEQPLEVYHEQGKIPENLYKEEGRTPSGRADAITWFDQSLVDCFGSEHKSTYSFDEYGHLILKSTEVTNDPYVSFDLKQYSAMTGLPMLRAEDYGVIVLRVLADKNIDGKGFTLYYYSGGMDFAQGERAITAQYDGGKWEYLVYEMAGKQAWNDQILGMRLDYAQQINTGQCVYLSDMLFFKDKDAWIAYATENEIVIPGQTPPIIENDTTPTPETEVPTIEIPTQGPGLEYIPPNQFNQNDAGCKNSICVSVILLVSCSALALIKNKTKKGDLS